MEINKDFIVLKSIGKFVWWAACLGVAMFLGLALWNFVQDFTPLKISHEKSSEIEISYIDFISIMLTGISIILAAFGFVVAILAFIGWNSIGLRATSAAEVEVRRAMKNGGQLHETIRQEAREVFRYLGMESINASNADVNETDFEEGGSDS